MTEKSQPRENLTALEILRQRYPETSFSKKDLQKLPELRKLILELEKEELLRESTNLAVLILKKPAGLCQLQIEMENNSQNINCGIPKSLRENSEEYVELELLKEAINLILESLTDKERKVIELRFGLIDGQCLNFKEVGKIVSLTPERIRQIEYKTMVKLRRMRNRNKIRDFLESFD